MHSLTKKITLTIATGALVLGGLTTSALANDNYHHENSDNEKKNYSHYDWDKFRGNNLFTFMNGEQEVPGPGDPDGKGFAKAKAFPDDRKFCVHMRVKDIDPATAAHVHEAPKGQSGPVVIDLPKPSEGYVHGCVEADSEKLKDIKENPSNYYLNVHNDPYPNGAIRGQLK